MSREIANDPAAAMRAPCRDRYTPDRDRPRRDRLPDGFASEIAAAEGRTASGEALHLRVALDYSARDAVLRAVTACEPGVELTRETLGRLISGEHDAEHRDVDLLIRSGGEKRLSDFLLWECAYAELFFSDRMWPDFGAEDLAAAVNDFRKRERRFGGVGNAQAIPPPVPSAPAHSTLEQVHTRR